MLQSNRKFRQAAVQGGVCVGGMLCLVHTFVVLLFVIQTIEQGEEGVCVCVGGQLGAGWGGGAWESHLPQVQSGGRGRGHGRVQVRLHIHSTQLY